MTTNIDITKWAFNKLYGAGGVVVSFSAFYEGGRGFDPPVLEKCAKGFSYAIFFG